MHPSQSVLRITVFTAFVGIILLGLGWELWLAPLRPGGSLLALKVVPLVIALPAIRRGTVRVFQWWSMGVLLYLCEGLVRASSDAGLSARLAIVETVLAAAAYLAILGYVRSFRKRRDE